MQSGIAPASRRKLLRKMSCGGRREPEDLGDEPRCQSADAPARISATLRTAFAIRAGNHHHVTISIAEPNLSVIGSGVNVRFFDNLSP